MKAKHSGTTFLRIASVLCGVFFLIVPRREMTEWSLIRMGIYYTVVLGYIAIASIRVRKVSQSLCWTTILFCIVAIPLLFTVTQVIASVMKSDLAGMDAYTWGGLLFVMILETLLPLALVVEFRAESRRLTAQTCV